MRPPKPKPAPPRPGLLRQPGGRAFGWLEAHLLHDGWLSRLAPDATAVLVLLALAADEHGASYYGRERMGSLLGLDRARVNRALAHLHELGLVAHRPWSPGRADGVWQLLPVPLATQQPVRPAGTPEGIRDILGQLGLPRSHST